MVAITIVPFAESPGGVGPSNATLVARAMLGEELAPPRRFGEAGVLFNKTWTIDLGQRTVFHLSRLPVEMHWQLRLTLMGGGAKPLHRNVILPLDTEEVDFWDLVDVDPGSFNPGPDPDQIAALLLQVTEIRDEIVAAWQGVSLDFDAIDAAVNDAKDAQVAAGLSAEAALGYRNSAAESLLQIEAIEQLVDHLAEMAQSYSVAAGQSADAADIYSAAASSYRTAAANSATAAAGSAGTASAAATDALESAAAAEDISIGVAADRNAVNALRTAVAEDRAAVGIDRALTLQSANEAEEALNQILAMRNPDGSWDIDIEDIPTLSEALQLLTDRDAALRANLGDLWVAGQEVPSSSLSWAQIAAAREGNIFSRAARLETDIVAGANALTALMTDLLNYANKGLAETISALWTFNTLPTGTGGQFVTVSQTQTLANKTITNPLMNGQRLSNTSQTANYAIQTQVRVVYAVPTAGATQILTMPSQSNFSVLIRNVGLGLVSIVGTGSQTIEGQTSLQLNPGQTVELHTPDNNTWRRINDALGGDTVQVMVSTTSGTVTVPTPGGSSHQRVTLTGAVTLAVPAGRPSIGSTHRVDLYQDATGGRVLTLPTSASNPPVYWEEATVPTFPTTPNARMGSVFFSWNGSEIWGSFGGARFA